MQFPATVRILLVDNDAHTREGLSELLRDDGFDVVAVASAAPALVELAHSRFDVVVVEVRLPGMNGVELTREIRARYTVPVVATAASDVWRSRLSLAGAASLHTKPVSYSALVRCLKHVSGLDPAGSACLRDDCACVGTGSTQTARRVAEFGALRQTPPVDD